MLDHSVEPFSFLVFFGWFLLRSQRTHVPLVSSLQLCGEVTAEVWRSDVVPGPCRTLGRTPSVDIARRRWTGAEVEALAARQAVDRFLLSVTWEAQCRIIKIS